MADLKVAQSVRRTSSTRDWGRDATVLGLGHYVPAETVPNASIAQRLGVEDAWIVRRTGIRSRRRAAPGERLSEIAAHAARAALANAGVEPAELDLVLVATMTQDELLPNTAPLVAHAVGAKRAGAIDIGAACVGWLAALSVGCGQIEAGRAECVLVVGADVPSRLTDHDDRRTAALFGDGAGAVVLGPTGRGVPGGVGPITIVADAALSGSIVASHEDRLIRMDGHETFKNAVTSLSQATLVALSSYGISPDEVDHFVYHQANGRILGSVRERLQLPPRKVADYIGTMGNTSAASIPLSLALLVEDARLHLGDRVLLAATGAGFMWGGGVLEWGLDT
jgi:3-oxoacyl-[acyl-carrier-protein] synthase-3